MANTFTEGPHESHYAHVKAIFAAAAGSSTSNYDGPGRFWDLPLSALVEAKWCAVDRAGHPAILLWPHGKPQRGLRSHPSLARFASV